MTDEIFNANKRKPLSLRIHTGFHRLGAVVGLFCSVAMLTIIVIPTYQGKLTLMNEVGVPMESMQMNIFMIVFVACSFAIPYLITRVMGWVIAGFFR